MNVTVNADLTSHIVNDDSTLECFLPNYNPETLVPFGSENEVRAFIATSVTANYFIPFKTPEQREAEAQEAAAAANAARAKQELLDTDWADLASVRNTANTPHLVNGADFDTYRLALRAIVIDPPVEVNTWPTRPTAVWA